MSLLDKIFGRPLRSSEAEKEELGVVTGVPVLGLDALSSTAYGPEAALTILQRFSYVSVNTQTANKSGWLAASIRLLKETVLLVGTKDPQ